MDYYVDRYPILKEFEEEIRKKIVLFYVSSDGDMAVVGTSDNLVYVLTSRSTFCQQLGLKSVNEAEMIEGLSNKKPVNINLIMLLEHYGKNVNLIIQTEEDIFVWNEEQKLGGEAKSLTTYLTEPEAVKNTRVKSISFIPNGYVQVLFDEHKVGEFRFFIQPFHNLKVEIFKNMNITTRAPLVQIAGNNNNRSKLARSSNGDVFILQIENKKLNLNPITALRGERVVDIACGRNHCLALTEEGVLFGWGDNYCGQLGNGTEISKVENTKPIKIEIPTRIGIAEIFAHGQFNISAARTYEGEVFIWGGIPSDRANILHPMQTAWHSIDKALAKISSYPGTLRTIKLSQVHSSAQPIFESISMSFDEEEFSDFQFIIEGKSIFVQKQLLKLRSEHFRTMFSSHWKENKDNQTEITQFSYEVYRAFLKYLYTGKVEISQSLTFELFDLANSYQEEGLKETCAHILGKNLKTYNVVRIYQDGLKYANIKLIDACVSFAAKNFGLVITSEYFLQLDGETKYSFLKDVSSRIDHRMAQPLQK